MRDVQWRPYQRRLLGKLDEYRGLVREMGGRLGRLRGRARNLTGEAQKELSEVLRRLEDDHARAVEGWRAAAEAAERALAPGEAIVERAAKSLARLREAPTAVVRRATIEAKALRHGVRVGLRVGRRVARATRRPKPGA